MAFVPIKGDEGKYSSIKAADAVTFVKGNACIDDGNGLLTNASAGGGVDIHWVVQESVLTTSSGQEVLCVRTDGVTFLADTDAAWAQTDILTQCDLGAAGSLDPNASDDDIFYIEEGVGVAGTSTQVIGHFEPGAPNA